MSRTLLEFLVMGVLLLANGFFAFAEISLISSRKPRLKKLADEGAVKARTALTLAEEPTYFLSAGQFGMTLVGILAGAFGGATYADRVATTVARVPALEPYSHAIGLFLVVGAITYFTLVFGELVPKRAALNNPERKAMLIAGPMRFIARISSPFVWVLTQSTNLVLRLLGLGREADAPPSEEEVSHLIEQGTSAGVFHRAERAMVEGVLRLDERLVSEIMTRRNRVVWLNISDPDEVNWRKVVTSGHSHFPVYESTRDNVLGLVAVKTLWANAAEGLEGRLHSHLTPALFVPETINAVQLLETFKKSGKHLALVSDEFGGIQGLVTLIDVMEAIVGDLPEPGDRRGPEAVKRDDGTWLVDGAMAIEELQLRFGLGRLPQESPESFETLGGFVLDRFGHIPRPGESFAWGGWRFEVMDMDRNRVDKVLLAPASK